MSKRNFLRGKFLNKAPLINNNNLTPGASATSLADILPGIQVRVTSFGEKLGANRRIQLMAYGLSVGTQVEVIQQSPVTIVQIDHTELALERNLAKEIMCQP